MHIQAILGTLEANVLSRRKSKQPAVQQEEEIICSLKGKWRPGFIKNVLVAK